MKENSENIQYYMDLIAKQLGDQISHDELSELSAWINESEENKELFDQLNKTWNITASDSTLKAQFDSDKAWNKFKIKLDQPSDSGKGKIRRLNKQWYWSAAASVAILVTVISLFRKSHFEIQTEVAYSESIQMDLKDGTMVNLDANSSLSYPKNFKIKERIVVLKGRAFFDVARNEKKPFKIESEEINIEVLGTSFFVDARDSLAELSVSVSTGRVMVRTNDGLDSIILVRGEKTIYDRSTHKFNKVIVEKNDAFWKTKTLVFKRTKLSKVADVLERNYNVKINFNNVALEDCRMTATFANQNIEEIIEVIVSTLGISYTLEEETTYLLVGSGCN